MSVGWDDVTLVLLTRWPGQKWGPNQMAGYITELQVDNVRPEQALLALRASRSPFVPSVGEVSALYLENRPPIDYPDQLQRAMARHEAKEAEQRHLRAVDDGWAVEDGS